MAKHTIEHALTADWAVVADNKGTVILSPSNWGAVEIAVVDDLLDIDGSDRGHRLPNLYKDGRPLVLTGLEAAVVVARTNQADAITGAGLIVTAF